MSNDAESDLAAFLAALPAYQRKQFEHGLPSLTQEEMDQWNAWMATAPQQFDALWQEYLRLVKRIPAKAREYREREIRDWAQNLTSLSLLPTNPEGRPRKDDLAAEAALLKKSGLSYAQIAMRLNREHGEGTTTKENIRGLLKDRRLRSSKTILPLEKT